MSRKVFTVSTLLLMTVLCASAPALDNTLAEGARKVEGGAREAGRSAATIGSKAAKAVEGAARDTTNALERAWDNIVRGLRKAFK